MRKLDMELSQEVAKQASEKINNAKKELEDNKDSYIAFMKDMICDSRGHNKFLKTIIVILFVITILLIGGMVGLNIYNQTLIKRMADENTKSMNEFIESFDFYSEVEILNELSDNNTNNLSINK